MSTINMDNLIDKTSASREIQKREKKPNFALEEKHVDHLNLNAGEKFSGAWDTNNKKDYGWGQNHLPGDEDKVAVNRRTRYLNSTHFHFGYSGPDYGSEAKSNFTKENCKTESNRASSKEIKDKNMYRKNFEFGIDKVDPQTYKSVYKSDISGQDQYKGIIGRPVITKAQKTNSKILMGTDCDDFTSETMGKYPKNIFQVSYVKPKTTNLCYGKTNIDFGMVDNANRWQTTHNNHFYNKDKTGKLRATLDGVNVENRKTNFEYGLRGVRFFFELKFFRFRKRL